MDDDNPEGSMVMMAWVIIVAITVLITIILMAGAGLLYPL